MHGWSGVVLVTTALMVCLFWMPEEANSIFLPLPTEIGDSFEFDLQLTIPYTITLPYYVGRRRRRRSDVLASDDDSLSPSIYNDDSQLTYNDNEAMLLSTLLGQSRPGLVLGLLDSLFDWLAIDDEPCQRRLVCLLTQNPDKYFPLSDLILNHMNLDINEEDIEFEATMMMMPNASYSRYISYWDIGRKGLEQKLFNCTNETLECNSHPDENINWTVLTIVQTVTRYLNLRFNSN